MGFFSKNAGVIASFIFLFSLAKSQTGPPPPFSFDLEPVSANLPGFHSGAIGVWGNKWLIIGGRTNGMHGMSSNDNFQTQYANNNIIVIDTTLWQAYYSSLSVLSYSVADPLRSTNMQYYQDSARLYLTGGFGWDSIQGRFTTFPVLSAIDIPGMINAVIQNTSIVPHIRQLTDTLFQVCGGEMDKLGGKTYLCFGHNFQGRYSDPPSPLFTQVYSPWVKKFRLLDDGVNLSYSNLQFFEDTTNFRRRDYNLYRMIFPNGNPGLAAFSGVFRPDIDLPVTRPVFMDSSSFTLPPYDQQMNNYTCAGIPIFDSVIPRMYWTFFGGMGVNHKNPQNNQVVYDSLVPFIDDITTMTLHPGGTLEEHIHSGRMPGLLGTNAKFILRTQIPSYSNKVINFRLLPPTRSLAGYIVGGIRGSGPNLMPSYSNDTVYRVYINPVFSGIGKQAGQLHFSIFPNPAGNTFSVQLHRKSGGNYSFSISDLSGQILIRSNGKFPEEGRITFSHEGKLAPGVYFLSLESEGFSATQKLIIF